MFLKIPFSTADRLQCITIVLITMFLDAPKSLVIVASYIISYMLSKWSCRNTHLSHSDGEKWINFFFSYIAKICANSIHHVLLPNRCSLLKNASLSGDFLPACMSPIHCCWRTNVTNFVLLLQVHRNMDEPLCSQWLLVAVERCLMCAGSK